MTFNQFIDAAITYVRNHPEQRVGQALMNALSYMRSDLYPKTPDIWEIDDYRHPEVLYWFEAVEREW